MKKVTQRAGIATLMILLCVISYAQVSNPTNGPGFAAQYVGWNAAQGFPLNISHFGPQPMRFRTNYALAAPTLGNRMIITDGNFQSGGGRIAIGNDLPDGFAPLSRLHLHNEQNGAPTPGFNFIRFTNNLTGVLGTSGSGLGISPQNEFQFRQWEVDLGMSFWTRRTAVIQQRMFLTHDVTADVPRLGIGNGLSTPLTYIHLGSPLATVGTGYRPWMNVGTLYVSDGFGAPDNMYVGLLRVGQDRHDAIISWSDNPTTTPAVADRLRFVFTSIPAMGVSSGVAGLELCRMTTDGTNPRIGFGDMFTPVLDPQNTVEIRASASSPYWNLPGGTSGLRFTFLTTSSTPVANPGTGVLTVDGNGDVIYVPASVANCFNATALTSNAGTDLGGVGGFNFHFLGNFSGSTLDNSVLIGKNCAALPLAKLDVLQRSLASGSIGINVQNTDDGGALVGQEVTGLRSFVPGVPATTGAGQIGVQGITSGEKFNVAIDGLANGVNGSGFTFNIGGRFIANSGGLNYAVYGSVPNLGFPIPSAPDYAGYFDGDVLSTTGQFTTSDVMFKENIDTIQNALQIISQLIPREYQFRINDFPVMKLKQGEHFGFVAQELEQTLPQLVQLATQPAITDTAGNIIAPSFTFKATNNGELIAILVKAVQEQQILIDSLFQNSNLRTGNTPPQSITLESEIILYQNMPNPFSDETSIRYFVPENASDARILFYDETGRVIKEENIQSLGNGTLTIKTSGLAAGIYTYALEVNGKLIQTRKMQKVK